MDYLTEDSWCPLFGRLPTNDIPSSQVYKCVQIITKARQLWKIPPVEKSRYPKDYIMTARTILNSHYSTTLHVIDGFYKRSDGKILEKHTLDSNWEFAVRFVRWHHYSYYFDYDIPDWAILAIFAIAEAWHVIKDILINGDSEDDPLIMKTVQDALCLLIRASEQYNAELAEAVEDCVRRGKRVEKGAMRGGMNKHRHEAPKIKAAKELAQSMAYAICRKHNGTKPLAKERVAGALLAKLKKELAEKQKAKKVIKPEEEYLAQRKSSTVRLWIACPPSTKWSSSKRK